MPRVPKATVIEIRQFHSTWPSKATVGCQQQYKWWRFQGPWHFPLQVTIPLGFLGDGNYGCIWHKSTFLNFFVYFLSKWHFLFIFWETKWTDRKMCPKALRTTPLLVMFNHSDISSVVQLRKDHLWRWAGLTAVCALWLCSLHFSCSWCFCPHWKKQLSTRW